MSHRKVIPISAFLAFISFVSLAKPVDDTHSLFTQVLRDHVKNGRVDYAAIKHDQRFVRYLNAVGSTVPSAIADEHDRLAFWINAYNAFTIKLILDHYPVRSIKDITSGGTGPWDIVWIRIGGKEYSLNQIENDIIRKEFHEARIHMALVCAARGCPPLRSEAYVGNQLDEQIDDNTNAFLKDQSRNHYDAREKTLYMSEVFKWYGSDFKERFGSVEAFVRSRLDSLDVQTFKYLPYDWQLNGK
jgi:Protein of unknown function, DUF547